MSKLPASNVSVKKWLITGGAGFIGYHLVCDLISDESNSVLVIDRDVNGGNMAVAPHADLQYQEFGVENTARFDTAIALFRPDCIVHLAATSRVADCEGKYQEEAIVNNVDNTATVLRIARKYATPRVLFASTGAVYDCNVSDIQELHTNVRPRSAEKDRLSPANWYGMTKRAGERLVSMSNELGMSACSLRIFNVFGQYGKGVVDAFLHAKIAGSTPKLNPTNVKRDYVYVGDVTKAIRLIAPLSVLREPINIGSGIRHSVSEVAELIGVEPEPIEPPAYAEPSTTQADNNLLCQLGWATSMTIAQYAHN